MNRRRTFTIICLMTFSLLSGIFLFTTLAQAASTITAVPETMIQAPTVVLADFEGGAPPGWFQYNGPGSSLTTSFVTVSGTGVLSVSYNVTD